MGSSTLTHFRAARCVLPLLATLLFTGCGTQKPDQTTPFMQGTSQANSGFYLDQMQQASNHTKTNWQLLAIHALLQEGNPQQASTLFAQLPPNLNDAQRREYALLAVEIKLAQPDYPAARTLLDEIKPNALNTRQQARYWKAQVIASEGKPSLALLRALIAEEPLLQEGDKQKNIDATWQALSKMTQEQANALVINADENTLRGWLDLQRVWFDNRSDPSMLKGGIDDWQIRYPNNPAAKQLPTPLLNAQHAKPASVNSIALLLSLNGQAAVFSRAIQQGFEAAKNSGTSAVTAAIAPPPGNAPTGDAAPAAESATASDAVASPSEANVSDLTDDAAQPSEQPEAAVTSDAAPSVQAAVSAPANPSAQLKIYDTSAQPLAQILSQVQQDGASMVVGPLLKNDVDELIKSNTSLNVLALNQPERVKNHPTICYFSLSPEDEARDAATHIWQQGQRNPLLLVPRSALGARVSSAFADEWTKLGGGTVLAQKLGTLADMRMGINGGPGIALTGSPVASTAPQQESVTIGGVTIPAPPSDAQQIASGGRVDAVYIVASREEVALIKPMIAMRTGSQSGVALYASSRSAQRGGGADFRLEMEGLQFSDIPMLTGANPALMQQALAAVNADYSLARLYAMGVDAWSLAAHFTQLRQTPGFSLSGNTGELTANQDCVISRKLAWLKYQQGQIVPAG